MACFDDIRVEIELSTGVWTDITDDVIGSVRVSAGIRGYGPLDRVAGTGKMQFTLQNEDNLYTPTLYGSLAGFAKGTPVRLVFELDGRSLTKFYGRIDEIDISKGEGLTYYTNVLVVDYMELLATHELQLPAIAEDKRIDEVVPLIIANMDVAPLSTEYNTGQDTFETVFDTTKATTRALTELAKVANSELGYIYVRPTSASDEVLTVEGRYTRTDYVVQYVTDPTNFITMEDGVALTTEGDSEEGLFEEELIMEGGIAAAFDDDIVYAAETKYGHYYYNDVKTVVYPREVDAAATSVLYQLDHYIQIGAGETFTVTGRFTDPNQEAQSIAGTAMVTPVATTDYLMNSASDGSGSDLTADLDVTATYGANGVEYELTNNNAATGYVTHLQARGKGIYTYHPVEYKSEYAAGITADGRKTLNLTMPYQSNPLVGESFAGVILDLYKDKKLITSAIAFDTAMDSDLLSIFHETGIGDKISFSYYDMNSAYQYYINGIDFEVPERGGNVVCSYLLMPESLLPDADFWKLDDSTYAILNYTTKLGY